MAQFMRLDDEPEGFWFEVCDDDRFGPSIVLVGRPPMMRKILLDPSLLPEPLADGVLAVVRIDWNRFEEQLSGFAADFGMSAPVTRMIVSLFRAGDVRAAAKIPGLSYETAREYLSDARELVGAGNLRRLVTLMGLGVAKTGRDAEESDAMLAYAFGLSERQTRIAGMIANGTARREVSQSLGASEALIKKELTLVFAAVGVSNAVALARALVELRLLAIATKLQSPRDPFPEAVHHRVSASARDGRRIAASDYGPWTGRPILVLHSSMTSRPANRALVEALQNSGCRPISIDRPGFGDTEAAPAECRGEDFFNLAASDVVDFCTAMGWLRIKLVSRGAAQVILALQRANPDLIEAAVIMNPDPDARSSSRRSGFLAAMKKNFARRPWAVALMSRWAVQSLTFERVRDNVMRSTEGCPADAQIMADPKHMADYYRGVIGFRHGKLDGLVREQSALATIDRPVPLGGTRQLTLLVGEQDSIHDPDETLEYWRTALPDACVEIVPGAGRFMSYSHPGVVVKALARRVAATR